MDKVSNSYSYKGSNSFLMTATNKSNSSLRKIADVEDELDIEKRQVLKFDATEWKYNYVTLPFLIIQFIIYISGSIKYIQLEGVYERVLSMSGGFGSGSFSGNDTHVGDGNNASTASGNVHPHLHISHADRYTFVEPEKQHDKLHLGLHMFAALIWVGAVMIIKYTISVMSKALDNKAAAEGTKEASSTTAEVNGNGGANGKGSHCSKNEQQQQYDVARRIHAYFGTTLIVIVLLGGAAVGWKMAYTNRANHPIVRYELLTVPFLVFTAGTMTYVSAKQKRWNEHRMWATFCFVLPPTSTLWCDWCINFLIGHVLAPLRGEFWGAFIGSALGIWWILIPAWKFYASNKIRSKKSGKHL